MDNSLSGGMANSKVAYADKNPTPLERMNNQAMDIRNILLDMHTRLDELIGERGPQPATPPTASDMPLGGQLAELYYELERLHELAAELNQRIHRI